jgi:hypothetical protein
LKQKTNYASDDWILAPWEIDEGIALRKHLPDVPMILLHSKPPVDHPDDAFFDKMKSIGFTWFSLNWQTVTQEFIDAAHKHDMRIYLWTVNDPADVAGGSPGSPTPDTTSAAWVFPSSNPRCRKNSVSASTCSAGSTPDI